MRDTEIIIPQENPEFSRLLRKTPAYPRRVVVHHDIAVALATRHDEAERLLSNWFGTLRSPA